jgi:hypothetical protein
MAGIPSNGTTNFNAVPERNVVTGPNSGITATDIEGFDFTLIAQSPAATMSIDIWDGTVGSGNGVAFYESTSSINPKFSEILIKSNSSARFDLLSIGINAQSGFGGNTVVTITGQTIGNVKAAGNSDIKQSYSFIHNYPANGVNNYRIIQVDLDGKRSISKIVSIKIQSISYLNISPNPVVSNTLNVRTNETLNIEIVDVSGKLMITTKTLVPGLNSIDISKIGKGIYFIKAPGQTIQFIKQ